MKTIDDITLVKTCNQCPEQYDAFIGDEQVGYLRLRHGFFTVEYPDCGGKYLLDTDEVRGDGMFNEDEREKYLNLAKELILKEYNSRFETSDFTEEVAN